MKRRILLVDDDMAVLLTLRAVLELNRFEVDTASSVTEAVQKMVNGVYELVITDSRMETENSGKEVIQEARRQSYRPATALLTAYPPLESEFRDEKASSILIKPIGTQELLRKIEALIVRHEGQIGSSR
jgi:DNA-binding response OmpR family regulator